MATTLGLFSLLSEGLTAKAPELIFSLCLEASIGGLAFTPQHEVTALVALP